MIDFTAQPGRQLGKNMCRYLGKIMCRQLGKTMCRLSILTRADLARHTKLPKVAAHGLAKCRLNFGPKLSHKTDQNTAAKIGPAELTKEGPAILGLPVPRSTRATDQTTGAAVGRPQQAGQNSAKQATRTLKTGTGRNQLATQKPTPKRSDRMAQQTLKACTP